MGETEKGRGVSEGRRKGDERKKDGLADVIDLAVTGHVREACYATYVALSSAHGLVYISGLLACHLISPSLPRPLPLLVRRLSRPRASSRLFVPVAVFPSSDRLPTRQTRRRSRQDLPHMPAKGVKARGQSASRRTLLKKKISNDSGVGECCVLMSSF